MENFIWNFPYIARQIFEDLDDKSLRNCLKVSTVWRQFIESEKFYWYRITEPFRGWEWDEILTLDSNAFCSLCRALWQMTNQPTNLCKAIRRSIHPIHCAIFLNDVDIFERLLPVWPDILTNKNIFHFNKTPLHLAAEEGSVEIVKLILNKLDSKDKAELLLSQPKMTPLHLAAKYGHLEVVKLLLKNIPEGGKNPKNYIGRTPYDLALSHQHNEVAEEIHEAVRKEKRPNERCCCGKSHKERTRQFLKRSAKKVKLSYDESSD